MDWKPNPDGKGIVSGLYLIKPRETGFGLAAGELLYRGERVASSARDSQEALLADLKMRASLHSLTVDRKQA